MFKNIQVVGGNVATAEGAKALIKAGANEEGVHSALSLLGINQVQEDDDEKEI